MTKRTDGRGASNKHEKMNIPPLREPYKLTEEQEQIIARYRDELEHWLKQRVSIECWTENYLAHPTGLGDRVFIELRTGNWKHIMSASVIEMDMAHTDVFYYTMRRLVDDTMQELLIRGASYT